MKFSLPMLLLLFISCNEKIDSNSKISKLKDSISPNDFYIELYNDKKYVDSLLNKIENEGDSLAYNRIYSISSLSGHYRELYYYQQIMAVKYNYPKAYFDMFNLMHLSDNVDLRKLSVYYLLKSCEMGYKRAIYYRSLFFLDEKDIPTANEYFVESDTTKFVHLKKMY